MLETIEDNVRKIGDNRKICVNNFVSSRCSPLNPGAISEISVLIKIKAKMLNPTISSNVKFRIDEASRSAACLSFFTYSEKTGIKATENVPKINKLKTKSGILNAAKYASTIADVPKRLENTASRT